MGYIADVPDFPRGLGCGSSCRCGPCRAASRLSESYVSPEDGDDDDADDGQKGYAMGCSPTGCTCGRSPLGGPRYGNPRLGAHWGRTPRRW
jgi:hypothetical protein